MFNTLSKLLFVFFTLPATAAPLECGPAKIKSVNFSKTSLTNAKICTNTTRDVLRSASCEKGRCAAFRIDKDLTPPTTKSAGKPGFELCLAADGLPEIIEFQFKGKWFKLDRCLFTKDGSFVDTGTLLTLLGGS